MNERIRELYNQSLEEKYQYGGSDAKPGEWYSNYITVLNPEKFAELIVEECGKLCEHKSNDDEYDQYDMGQSVKAENIKTAIKQHFGVEE
jgi:hypothetical protein